MTNTLGESAVRVGVVLASLGRPEDLTHILNHLAGQTKAPALIILSLERAEDAPLSLPPGVEVIYGPRGLCAQRNRGLDAVRDRCDAIVFFDDDFVPSRSSIAGISETFAAHPDVAGATGKVLADGVRTGGVQYDQAKRIVGDYDAQPKSPATPLRDIATAYGCNMAFRWSAISDLRFDERLPLYGWQEDVDFAGRVRKRGRMVETDAFAGVHCGVTKSRMPGKRLGYSQVVNPIYLLKKGSMRPSHVVSLIVKNMISNHLRSLAPEAHIDRRGRALGNWIGMGHVLRGQIDPMAVLSLDAGRAPAAAPQAVSKTPTS